MLTMNQEDSNILRDLKPSQELLETIAEVRGKIRQSERIGSTGLPVGNQRWF